MFVCLFNVCSLKAHRTLCNTKHAAWVFALICKLNKNVLDLGLASLSFSLSVTCPSTYVSSPILSFLLGLNYLFQLHYYTRNMAPSSEPVSVI